MTKEQFFKWHANAGGKILTCYIGGKLVHPTYKDWMKIPRNTKIELPLHGSFRVTDTTIEHC